MKVSEIFNVKYGVNLELNSLELDSNGINFVSRTSKNNGVSAKVKVLPNIEPIPSGTISVAAGGSVMESYLQPKPYYSGRDLFYLSPKKKISEEVLLYYCLCLKKNRYKFSYGRQANVSLKELDIPAPFEIIKVIKTFSLAEYKKNMLLGLSFPQTKRKSPMDSNLIVLSELFDTINGIPSSIVPIYDTKQNNSFIPYIRPSYRQNTSISGYVKKIEIEGKHIFPKETLYVSTNGQGSHTYSYVATSAFVPNSDVTVLIPKKKMSLSEKLFYSHCISNNRYKFSYGRKPKGGRLKSILLPASAPSYITDKIINKIVSEWSKE